MRWFSVTTLLGGLVLLLPQHVTTTWTVAYAASVDDENTDSAADMKRGGGQQHDESNVPMKAELQNAIIKLQNAFDPQKSDFLERLLAQEDTRLAHFVPDEMDLTSIEEDLVHFRSAAFEGAGYAGEADTMATVALPLLKSAINKLHFALNRNDESKSHLGDGQRNLVDATSTTRSHEDMLFDGNDMNTAMIDEAIVDLAAAIDGDDDDMNTFIDLHKAVITKVLKTSITALHDALNNSNNEEEHDPLDILQRLLLLDEPTSSTAVAAVADAKDTKAILASLLGGGGGDVVGQQLPIPITEIIAALRCGLAVALRYVLIIPYIIFPFFIPIPILFTCLIWRQDDLTCPVDVIRELFFFNPVTLYASCILSLPFPLPGA